MLNINPPQIGAEGAGARIHFRYHPPPEHHSQRRTWSSTPRLTAVPLENIAAACVKIVIGTRFTSKIEDLPAHNICTRTQRAWRASNFIQYTPLLSSPSQRKLIAQKIQSVVKRDMELGLGTGFVRRARYEKSAAGGTQPQDQSATGNAANAKVVAAATATSIVKKRRLAFAPITGGAELSTAKVDSLTKLKGDSYGLVLVDGELMIAKVLTLYERGGGKAAKHGWVSEASSIGAVSYIPVQVWRQMPHQRRFRAVWYEKTIHLALPRFQHLPSSRFLLYIPSQSVQVLPSGILELTQAFYDVEFMKYHQQTAAIAACVERLIAQLRKRNESADSVP
ncbi:hypothetical protein NMY22_g709 [Coprinellus aureogranulatus]|nr:hypothetical protein NMY22_g709 [Coprinellus aureogranulatus]